MITKAYYKVYRVFPDPDYFYVENIYSGSNTFTLSKQGTPTATNLEYSLDKKTWTAFDLSLSSNTVTIPTGGKLYIRGDQNTGFSKDSSNILQMKTNYNSNIGGNIMTLVDYTNADGITTVGDYWFNYLFKSYSTLVDASQLNFGNVASVGEKGMANMFYYCSSLTTAPDLSSITSVGSSGMADMFHYCSSLTTSPDLSSIASVGRDGMANMFRECSSLTTAPDLSNITSVGSNSPFFYILYNCTLINYVIAPSVSKWETQQFLSWLSNVSATGVIQKPASLTIPTDTTSGVPTGWTTVDR